MLANHYIDELQREIISTRKMLERIPQDKLDWKPHDKSMSLARLATHVAEIPGYIAKVVTSDGINFKKDEYKPHTATSTGELLDILDKNVKEGIDNLKTTDDTAMMQSWTLSGDGTPIFTAPRIGALRGFVFSHLIHHRGQLSVYLRLLNIPVPSIYGPSADERPA